MIDAYYSLIVFAIAIAIVMGNGLVTMEKVIWKNENHRVIWVIYQNLYRHIIIMYSYNSIMY